MPESRLHQLSALGQSVWIDSLSREWLRTGELARMMAEDAVVGVTSNPTIFQKAMSEGDWYDDQLREVLAEVDDPKEIFLRLAFDDIREACDLMRKVWDGTQGQDGYVSLEVEPGIAHDTEATIEQAQRFHDEIDKPNLYVKIPATAAGVPAIEEMIARGKRINVTLIFGLDRYAEVAEAYIRGLERLVESGGDPRQVTSVASFFVSRVDTEADKRLDAIGGHDHLAGRLAIANAKLAYQRYKELFSGSRWEALAARGASTQRCLWASTSTKNPEYRDVMYIEELIGPETVNTMPKETIEAFQDHGEVRLTLEEGLDEAAQALRRAGRCRRGLRRRDEGARGGGRAEVRRLVRRAPRGRRREARAARSGLSTLAPAELVERIWERDPSVWTGRDEAHWLGWLDEPARMRERAHELLEFATRLEAEVDDVVLMGMGGSSLAPEVMRRSFGAEHFHVLDTTHPTAIRRLEERIDAGRTLFVAASKSGTTLETRSHADYFRKQGGRFAVVTDPGSPLVELSDDVFFGEPTIGGRYSALSVFGLLPAALMGVDVARLLDRAEEMREACRRSDGNPGLELGLWLAEQEFLQVDGGFGLWVEQLVAESTGKEGKGIVPVREGGEAPEIRLPGPYELGQEFFRWEFATAVAGSILGINPFDQPDVQAAKDKTNAVLSGQGRVSDTRHVSEGHVEELLAEAGPGRYVAIQAFIDPDREGELDPLVRQARETGAAVSVGLGPALPPLDGTAPQGRA